jgi:hypothetical protein
MTSTSDLAWEVVATLPDVASAHVLATMIRGEGVPAMVVTDSSLLGKARRSDVRYHQDWRAERTGLCHRLSSPMPS